MIYDILWVFALVGGFLGLLVLPAAVIESRWGRAWIERLSRLEEGRIRQQADWLLNGSDYGRKE